MEHQQGQMLGRRYRLDTVVGRGGMGTVWLAYDEMLDRQVAVKEVLLPPGLSDGERDVLYQRTFREARASARLNHPGVVTVHDVLEETGRPWIVMEFVRARSLQELIDEEGRVPPWRAADIGRQVLLALRHAHQKGILHRDVKPSNVLITDDDRVVLTDFGIAQVEGDATLTQTGLVMGSPAYIPPERAQGERAVPASDLWALGATLYAAVEGRSPYERSDAMASLAAVLSESVRPARNAGPLWPVLDGLLARRPADRMTADRALPMLTEAATSRGQVETVRDPGDLATRSDEPSGPRDFAAETVSDSAELEALGRYGPPAPRPGEWEPEQRTLLGGDWTTHSPEPPPTWGPPHPAPARPDRERTKTIAIVVIAGVLVVAAVLAGALILRGKRNAAPDPPGYSGRPQEQVTVTVGTAGGNTPTPKIPPGYTTRTEDGFAVAVPQGWTRQVQGQNIFYRAPDGSALLQVSTIAWTGTPTQQAQAFSAAQQGPQTRFPGYTQEGLAQLTYLGGDAADLQFSYVSEGVHQRAVDRFFRAGGREYAIYYRTTAAAWSGDEGRRAAIFGSFRPG
ncbi:serine/threonine protein kinase [Actinomadura craniellae]|uniref:non-specific serine/threonine protein kinase n=1 Tax=Actinomadura craniellae TaxID=2231787 RepID=A0A365H991_9ACTN|nr:serine/threonine-protein kinase [Actinomadura craniellae]RAY15665.1 serine/threonine protein kinase [Actinomadura craniellae]